VRTGVTAQISREAEVSALGRALAVERRARYIDFRGKRTTFSTFMRITADRLCKRFPSDSRWSTIRGLFTHYANLDVASRISIVRRTEELLFVPETPEKEPEPVFVNPAPKKPPAPARPPQDPATVDIKYVKGVGPKIAELFHKLGINTAGDLIRHYPRHHLDFQNRMLIRELEPGQEVTVFGTIRSVNAFQSRNRNVSIMTIVIGDGTGSVIVSRFIGGKSNKYLLERYKSQFPKGAQVLASGVVERDRHTNRLQLKNAEIEILTELGDTTEEAGSLHTNRLVPVYPLTEGLGLRHLRNVMHNALEAFEDAIKDPLPESVRLQNNLIGLREALWGIHFPEDVETKDAARKRLVFDELFGLQLRCRSKFLKAE
jgi:ATP-dependent DNA helicase RecG